MHDFLQSTVIVTAAVGTGIGAGTIATVIMGTNTHKARTQSALIGIVTFALMLSAQLWLAKI